MARSYLRMSIIWVVASNPSRMGMTKSIKIIWMWFLQHFFARSFLKILTASAPLRAFTQIILWLDLSMIVRGNRLNSLSSTTRTVALHWHFMFYPMDPIRASSCKTERPEAEWSLSELSSKFTLGLSTWSSFSFGRSMGFLTLNLVIEVEPTSSVWLASSLSGWTTFLSIYAAATISSLFAFLSAFLSAFLDLLFTER